MHTRLFERHRLTSCQLHVAQNGSERTINVKARFSSANQYKASYCRCEAQSRAKDGKEQVAGSTIREGGA